MSTNTTETKSERLILNFTVHEREELKQLYLKSRSASESDFVRRAVELYADLYNRVVKGAKIVLMHAEKGPRTVPVPRHWNRETMPLPERETPRRNFEVKIEGASKETITQIVKAGAAPSAARLAWAALGTYALIVERTSQGFVLMENRNEQLMPINHENQIQPTAAIPDPVLVNGDDPGAVTFASIDAPVPRVLLHEVLEWEKTADITDFYVDAPFLTIDRWKNDRQQIVEVMTHNFKAKLTNYIYLLAQKEDQLKLERFIEEEFVRNLPWHAFHKQFHNELKNKVAGLPERLKKKTAEPNGSPVWALVYVGVLELNEMVTKGFLQTKLEHLQVRLFRSAFWYARLRDGSLKGYKFPMREPAPSQDAFLNPLDTAEIDERMHAMHAMASDSIGFINLPERQPSSQPSTIVPFSIQSGQ